MLLPKDVAAPTGVGESVLQVYLLGTVEFETMQRLQRRLHFDIRGDRAQAALVLCEHPPLISVGRQGSRAHIRMEDDERQTRGWPIRWVNRGGGCWLHLPGQLAIYALLPLDNRRLSVHQFLDRLGQTTLDTLGDFSMHGKRSLVEGGVASNGRLIAATGVAVRDWVSYYGACLNLHPRLDPFRSVRCFPGPDLPMTSLERERHGAVRPAHVRECFVEHFRACFGFERVALFSDHPMLHGQRPRLLASAPNG